MLIINKKFNIQDFKTYVGSLDFIHASFKPLFVVHHNTSSPTRVVYENYAKHNISDEQWIKNLADYYIEQGWQHCPHLVIVPSGIIVMNPLTERGTHTPSWNFCSWGIEMVGDYDSEPFQEDIYNNTVAASAILHHAAGLSPLPYQLGRRGLHFHKDDPNTTHKDCPGKNIIRTDFVERVMKYMETFIDKSHPENREQAVILNK